MSVKFCCQPPSAYPEAEMQCVIDCMEGNCQESDSDKLWAHDVVKTWAISQGLTAGIQPQGKGPVTVKELKALHAAYKTGKKMATPFNWLALVQLIVTAAGPILQAILALLNQPQPPQPPTP